MVTTTYSIDPRYRATAGSGYEGVVRVSFGGYYGTGSLLYDGRAILTAAHLFAGKSGTATVQFETSSGIQTFTTAQIAVHPGYDANSNNDLAIVWLDTAPPLPAERYTLYRDSDEIGHSFTFSGYGMTGTGNSGAIDGNPIRLQASNRFDAEGATLTHYLGAGMSWTPLPGSQLIADFDNGSHSNDALGQLTGRYDTGLGLDEGLIAPGDSGGPAFIAGKIAGVASYIASLGGSNSPDIDAQTNSSFGEIGAWQRVSAQQQWIDQTLRQHYPNPPTTPNEVEKWVPEGDGGTHYAYFLLQFIGVRADPEQILSVDYATRDGTALAGRDYLAVSDTLRLYPDENQAVIPVEVIGDETPEPDEIFYLDVFNPVGGSFGAGVLTLTAARTIVDDDGWLG